MLMMSGFNGNLNIWTVVALLVVLVSEGYSSHLQPGTCSTKCGPRTGISSEEQTDDPKNYPCSCSPSCSLYGDCCYNSPYRNQSYKKPEVSTICLPIYRRRQFLAVNSCPKSWKGSSKPCDDGLGHSPPVTSHKTSITYSNIHCARCNDDDIGIIIWNTTLRCCALANNRDDEDIRIVTYRQKLWKALVDEKGSLTFCQCTYTLNQDAGEFLNTHEVRGCDRNEISTCSRTWDDKSTYDTCKSYLDPVYIRNKVYRNLHCAMCNYENEETATCVPLILKDLYEKGLNDRNIREFCRINKLETCLHFLSREKGRVYAFSELFIIDDRKCFPPPGKRCCDGQQYDFKQKRCRKIVP